MIQQLNFRDPTHKNLRDCPYQLTPSKLEEHRQERQSDEQDDQLGNRLSNQLDPIRLLIVDDDRLSRIMLASLLGASNIVVSQAENGLDALYLYQRDSFDVVLTDLRMPVMDGETLAIRLRDYEIASQMQPCRLIALAAIIERPEETLLTAGMFDVALEKPALIGDVLSAIFEH